ncbi:hypothetical protein ES708_10998 [subsurface metagenome]
MPVAINNAEIIVSLSAYDPFSEMFPPPEKLELKTMNENNEFILVFDAFRECFLFSNVTNNTTHCFRDLIIKKM